MHVCVHVGLGHCMAATTLFWQHSGQDGQYIEHNRQKSMAMVGPIRDQNIHLQLQLPSQLLSASFPKSLPPGHVHLDQKPSASAPHKPY